MHEWVTVARTQDVPDGELAAATLDGLQIVLANAAGEYRAVRRRVHARWLLARLRRRTA
jgi:nitrite reductase/ring-hydroxylating ferredoxin subunit